MKKILLVSAIALLIVSSCQTSTYYMAYNIGLSSVEKPKDKNIQYGDFEIVNKGVEPEFDNNGKKIADVSKYNYEDEYISIEWKCAMSNPSTIAFELTNKTQYTMKIDWNNITYVDINGIASRTIHGGIKYVDMNEPQEPSYLPKNAKMRDAITPISNISFSSVFNLWITAPLFNCRYDSKENMQAAINAQRYVGDTFKILFPIEIEGTKNDYTFEFKIGEIYNSNENN